MAKAKNTGRSGLPLGWRLLGLCLVAIAVTAGLALIAGLLLGGPSASDEREEVSSLDGGFAAFASLEGRRYERLRLIGRSLAEDTGLMDRLAVILASEGAEGAPPLPQPLPLNPADAEEETDPATVALTLLESRRNELTFDLAIVLNLQGVAVLRTDQPGAAGEDLSAQAPVAQALRGDLGSGLWRGAGQLYYVAVSPLEGGIERGLARLGYVLVGARVDEALLTEVRSIARADLMVLDASGQGVDRVAQTLDDTLAQSLVAALERQAGSLAGILGRGEPVTDLRLDAGGRTFLAQLGMLHSASGEPLPAAVVILVPAREGSLGRLWLALGILAAGLAGAFVVAPLALLVGRGLGKDARNLAVAVEAARHGDLGDAAERLPSGALLGVASDSLRSLLRSVAEERALAAVAAALAEDATEPGPAERSPEPPPVDLKDVTLVAVEMSSYTRVGEPAEAVARVQRDVRRVADLAERRGGRLDSVRGHRLMLVFGGEEQGVRALGAAADLLHELGQSSSEEEAAPSVAVSCGRAVVSRTQVAGDDVGVTLGLPVQMLESLLREAGPGDLLVSRDLVRKLKDRFAAAGLEPTPQRAVLTPLPIFALDPAVALEVAGPQLSAPDSARAAAGGGRALGPGQVLDDRFELLAQLDTHPYGKVFEAADREVGRKVCLTLFAPSALSDIGQFERLDSDLSGLRRLSHPSIARTYDFGVLAGTPFLCQERRHGLSLDRVLAAAGAQGVWTGPAAMLAARSLARGLAAAHSEGIAHGQLGPSSVVFSAGSGRPSITGFGIALVTRLAGPGLYRAPEQAVGSPPTQKADVYGCGLLLVQLFGGGAPSAAGQPPPLPPGAPAPLAQALGRCLAIEPAERFEDARQLAAALEPLSL